MEAFYDEGELKIAFKHCYDFQLESIDWATVFIALADSMAYFIIVRF